MNQQVFIIIVNYKQPEITIKCINSVKQSENIDPFIVLVDNHSEDQSLEIFHRHYDDDCAVHLIESDDNNGFAAGNNIGINYAIQNNARYIMLLNNDTEIEQYMIKNLLDYANEKTVVSPKMYFFDKPKTIWFAGGKYQRKTGRFVHIGEGQSDNSKYEEIIKCDFLTGCCFMIDSNTIKKVGMLDESYFMYLEDVDYSLRLNKAGIEMLMIPKAKLWHKVGSSSGGERSKTAVYYGNRNRFYLQHKFRFSFFSRFLLLQSRILLLLRGIINDSNEKYILRSIIDYYSGNMGKAII